MFQAWQQSLLLKISKQFGDFGKFFGNEFGGWRIKAACKLIHWHQFYAASRHKCEAQVHNKFVVPKRSLREDISARLATGDYTHTANSAVDALVDRSGSQKIFYDVHQHSAKTVDGIHKIEQAKRAHSCTHCKCLAVAAVLHAMIESLPSSLHWSLLTKWKIYGKLLIILENFRLVHTIQNPDFALKELSMQYSRSKYIYF